MDTFLTGIAKLIASPMVRNNLKKAEDILERDPEMVSLINGIQMANNRLASMLPRFCERHPESNLCKRYANKR
jgi:hypothetical protein